MKFENQMMKRMTRSDMVLRAMSSGNSVDGFDDCHDD